MVSRRVYFAVFGSGLGHVTRVLDVARRVEAEGYEPQFSSSGQGSDFLRSNGEAARTLEGPYLDVRWGAEGGFSSWHVLPHFPFTFNTFLRQLAFEQASIPKFDPSLVVSDSRLSAVLAARAKSYPVVTILNQFYVAFPPRFRSPMGRFYERVAGDSLGLMWSLSDRVLMTDLPPPYTIGEGNLVGSDMSRVVEFVGFTSPRVQVSRDARDRVRRMLDLDGRPVVFAQISGPDATKERFAQTVTAAAEEIGKSANVVVSLGYPAGSREPRRLTSGAWLFEWCPVKDELFDLSDLVVARAGHSTIGQCINAGKPAVLVPIHNHPEQIGNAEKFQKLGLGVAIRSEDLTEDHLADATRRCLDDEKYRMRAESLGRVSSRYDGIEKTAQIIRSYS